jgi:hypothetical protein
LTPVDLDLELRRAGLERDSLDPGLGCAFVGDRPADVLELRVIEAVVAELDLHLEPCSVADALDRRRDQDEARALLQLRQPGAQLGVEAAQILAAAALAPVLEDHVGGAGIGQRGIVVDHRDPADRDRVRDAGRGAHDARHPVHGLLGALERGANGQLDCGDDVALVLERNESSGQPREAPDRKRAETDADRGHEQTVPHGARHEAGISTLGGVVDAVERAEHDVAPLGWRPQPECALRRLERGGVDRADQRGRGHHQRELSVQLPRDARQERGRQKHRHQHERDPDDRAEQLGHGADRCVLRRQALLDVPGGSLDHDDGVVDHDADRQHDREQGR